eukprot:superscaffoldBa00000066_g1073
MSHLKPNAQEDKDVEPVSDSPGRTQEPLQSHTFSLKNNAAGLSSDEHENPLNGTQPNPFVYRSVPAVPHAGNSLPSGALVNGPGSHPTSEVHCVLNKGTVLSNNVLDAAWQPEKDTSPEVLPPPSELQSDAWKNTAGPVVKTLATQPGVNTPLSHSEENESKLAYSTLLSQRLQKQSADRELEKGCEGNDNFSDDTSEATGSFLESSENERNPYARRYFRKRQRFSAKDQSSHVLQNEDDGDEDCSDIEQLIIKEEYIETTVCDDSLESPFTSTSDSFDVLPTPGVEHKLCPYCPAMFESGVGLSNHVRGHLHRVGLSYNARHMVSPEQVALRDRQPRIRRRIPTGMRKVRKAVKPETQGEHTCPLCWGWFDTKTGLSNHVRGHLKRIGRSGTSSSKSPLCILNELLQDKKEHHNILQVLNKSQFPSQPFVSQKFISSNGLFLMRTGLPVKIQYEMRSPHPILDSFVPKQETEAFSEQKKLQLEAQRGTKASSSILVELLKARQESMELTARNKQETYATKLHDITKDCMEETEVTSVEPNWAHGECDSNKSCLQCNSGLPTAVSLSGRLQAYACRKRIAILEEPGYDYKQKKPRLRPGLKKKILPSLNAEMYTLTCRFCDLVFQGPLSIQEDWIKHLQRHLLHTSVPYSGTGMVEVLGLHHKIQISMSHQHSDPE